MCVLGYALPIIGAAGEPSQATGSSVCAAAIEGENEFLEAMRAKSMNVADEILSKILRENGLNAVKGIIGKVFASGDILMSAVYFLQFGRWFKRWF